MTLNRIIMLRLVSVSFWATTAVLAWREGGGNRILAAIVFLFGLIPALIDLSKFLWWRFR